MRHRLARCLVMTLALWAAPGFAAKNTKDAAKPAQAAPNASASAQSDPSSTRTKPEGREKALKGGPTQNATAAQIADAKAKGLVWVNTGTGVYHNDGQYFGATKEGKFATEAEAKKAGYRSAKHPATTAKAAGK